MSISGNRVIKNTSVLLVSQIITWGLTTALTLFLPRYIGPEGNGVLAIASSVWAITAVLISFGMDIYLMKMIAREPEHVYTWLGTSLAVRVIIYLISIVPVGMIIWRLNPSWEIVLITQLIGVSFFINALANATTATLQGLEVMEYISISAVISKAVNAIVGIGLLLLGYRLLAIAAVLVLSALVLFVVQLYYLNRYRPLHLGFDARQIWPILRASAPYVASALVIAAYSEINVLTIGSIMSVTEAGWYGAAVRLFATLLFFPVVYTTALLPQLTRTFHQNPDAVGSVLRKGLDLMMLVGIPIGLGLSAISPQLVSLFFGSAYEPTAQVLQVLGIALIWMYLNVLLGQYFTAIDRQNTWTVIIAIAAVLMTGSTILIVPWSQQQLGNGAMGGAISLSLSEFGMVLVGMVLLRGELLNRATLWTQCRIVLSGVLMMAVALSLSSAPLLITIIASGITYITLIALLRVIPQDDIDTLLGIVRSLFLRLRSRQRDATTVTSE